MARRRDIERLSEEIDELFSDLWQVPRFARQRRGFRPDVDCFRTDHPPTLTVVVDLAGVDPADVRVDATPEALLVRGERRRPSGPGHVYQQMEIAYGPFECRVPLGAEVDTGAASATYESGLLEVVLPLTARAPRPAKVPIRIEAGR
jgi:HSP20 family molecular chaperone IbpA